MMMSIKIIAAKPGIFLLLRKLYKGSKINVIINATKNGMRIVLSSFKRTNEKTTITIDAIIPRPCYVTFHCAKINIIYYNLTSVTPCGRRMRFQSYPIVLQTLDIYSLHVVWSCTR
jgi:hypothetical protein